MKARVALLASLVSLCLVAGVAAQVSTVEGTVVSTSGGSLVVDTGSGQRTFMVDAQSSLPTNLATGARVKVEYHTLANDKLHAFKVSSAAATTGTTTTTPTDRTDVAATAATPIEPTGATRTDTTTGTTMQDRPTTTTTTTGTGTMQDRTPNTAMDTPTTPTTSDDTMATGRTRQLPATASPLPLMALAGGLAMAGGALMRRLRS